MIYQQRWDVSEYTSTCPGDCLEDLQELGGELVALGLFGAGGVAEYPIEEAILENPTHVVVGYSLGACYKYPH